MYHFLRKSVSKWDVNLIFRCGRISANDLFPLFPFLTSYPPLHPIDHAITRASLSRIARFLGLVVHKLTHVLGQKMYIFGKIYY